jgi:hypothetical protein
LNSQAVLTITSEMFSKLYEGLKVTGKADLGVALILVGIHPIAGECALMSTSDETFACLIQQSKRFALEHFLGL